jgi:hypothetical protein
LRHFPDEFHGKGSGAVMFLDDRKDVCVDEFPDRVADQDFFFTQQPADSEIVDILELRHEEIFSGLRKWQEALSTKTNTGLQGLENCQNKRKPGGKVNAGVTRGRAVSRWFSGRTV